MCDTRPAGNRYQARQGRGGGNCLYSYYTIRESKKDMLPVNIIAMIELGTQSKIIKL